MAPKPYWLTPKTRSPTSELFDGRANSFDLACELAAEDLPPRSQETGGEAADEKLGAAKFAVGPV
jgi:hypothetical protein